MRETTRLPPITLATHDYNRLMSAASMKGSQRGPHHGFLMAELRRASLCHPDAMPDDVVATDAKVTFRIGGSGRSMARILVYPEDLLWPGAELSVTTPLGIALLGLRVGDRMPFRTGSDGPVCEVVVEDVRFRPRPRQAEPILNPSDRTGGGDDGSSDCAGRRPDGDLAAGDPVSAIVCGRH
jgi:transcription elongation GreA/GreB family factor